jgi:cell cycle sensor histidine kinase DivJ
MVIESRLGAGTSVSVRLPVLLAPLRSVVIEPMPEAPAITTTAPEPEQPPTSLGDNIIAFAPR